jgi:hypothetical protein
VTPTMFGGPEALSIGKATYAVARAQWTVTGSTNWFGPQMLNTVVTCWIGKGIAVGPLVGSGPVDITGKFAVVPPSLTTPPPDATALVTCQSSNGASATASVTVK